MKINYLLSYCKKKSRGKTFYVLQLVLYLMLSVSLQIHAITETNPRSYKLTPANSISDDQQVFRVSGVITDAASNEVLAGVTVAVEGTSIGTFTDSYGKFSLTVPSASSVLVISYVGYTTLKIPVNGQSTINVALTAALLSIDEVVVVGYGTQKKATVTGAIASIGTKSLVQSPQANISNSLVGRMTGLLSVQRSGEPGADQSILRIRGFGTFTGSQEPLIMVDGIETDNYNNIDPNEIESISILKDASATAVYGVRGANGVLIITTRRGRVGKPQVSISSQYATSRFTNIRHGMQGYEYAKNFNLAKRYDGYVTGGYEPVYSEEAIEKYKTQEDPIFYPFVDWYPYMFDKNSGQVQHNINVNGGTENVKYFFSLGYFDQEGLIKHTDLVKEFDAQPRYKRYNIRSNFDFNITKRLSASVNLSTQIENRSGTAASLDEVFEACWAGNPLSHPDPAYTDGKYVVLEDALAIQYNPILYLFANGYQKDYRNYLNSSLRFNYMFDFITKGLSSHVTLSYNNYNRHHIHYSKQYVTYKAVRLEDQSVVFVPQADPEPFSFSESFGKNRKTYLEVGLDYARNFGDHNLTGLLLYNQSKRHDPNLAYLIPNGYQGIVGRATYDYKGRYLAEVNIGYNGTENFAPGKRFGFFPAYSLGWVISEEPIFPENPLLTYLKFRASYGVVGNDEIGGERFLYRSGSYYYEDDFYHFGETGVNQQGYKGALPSVIGNPDLTWERAKKIDIGGELNLLKDKIKFSFDYFNERRDNILANKNSAPDITGLQGILPALNMGKMKNRGYEGDFSFNNTIGKLRYWFKANYSYAHNTIEYMDEIVRTFPYQYRTGQRLGQFFGLVADGLYNSWEEVNDANRPVFYEKDNRIQPGDIRYIDINGDGIISGDDRVPIGYSDFPEKILGFSLGGDYKGFDLSILFQGASNVSARYTYRYVQPFLEASNAADYMVESWSQERYDQGLPIRFPRLSCGWPNSPNYVRSSFWTVDASYLRLKNAEIGYSLPEQWLKKTRLGINYLRIYINGNNLITWDKMLPGTDPEVIAVADINTDPYPVTRTINFGINVKF